MLEMFGVSVAFDVNAFSAVASTPVFIVLAKVYKCPGLTLTFGRARVCLQPLPLSETTKRRLGVTTFNLETAIRASSRNVACLKYIIRP
jgi:hypothetical protein